MKDSSDISRPSVSSNPSRPQKTITLSSSTITIVVVIVLALALGFVGGMAYQKHNTKNNVANSVASGRGGLFGGRFGGGGFGSVTAISPTSITVSNTRSGQDKTFAITSSTAITSNGQTASISDISTGDTVVVIPSSSNASDAATILINPSFGGPRPTGSSTSSITTQ